MVDLASRDRKKLLPHEDGVASAIFHIVRDLILALVVIFGVKFTTAVCYGHDPDGNPGYLVGVIFLAVAWCSAVVGSGIYYGAQAKRMSKFINRANGFTEE